MLLYTLVNDRVPRAKNEISFKTIHKVAIVSLLSFHASTTPFDTVKLPKPVFATRAICPHSTSIRTDLYHRLSDDAASCP